MSEAMDALIERCNDLSDLIRSKTDEHHKRLGGLDRHVDWLEQNAQTLRRDIEKIEARLKNLETGKRHTSSHSKSRRGASL